MLSVYVYVTEKNINLIWCYVTEQASFLALKFGDKVAACPFWLSC